MLFPFLANPPPVLRIFEDRPIVTRSLGFGVQWDPYEYEPSKAHWQETERRVGAMRLGLLRVCIPWKFYCYGFGATGEPTYAWGERGNRYLNDLDRILRFAQKRNIAIVLGQWSPAERLSTEDSRGVRMFADLVTHYRKRYSVVQYANYVNEPNGDWSGNKSYESWREGMKRLRVALDERRMQAVKIVGPDTTGNTNWTEPFEWLKWTTRDLRPQVGADDLHWYATDDEIRSGKFESLLSQLTAATDSSLPRFLGEVGILTGKTNGDQQPRVRTYEYSLLIASLAAQTLRAGWQGAIAWSLDDAMHVNEGPATNPPGPRTLKLWGMWNTQGTTMGQPEEEKIRPWGKVWTIVSRLFPKGCSVLRTESAPTGLTVVAGQSGKQLSLMLVNLTDSAQTTSLAPRNPRLWRTDYQESTPTFSNPTVVSGSLTIKAKSIAFLSTDATTLKF